MSAPGKVSEPAPIIQAEALSKRYRRHVALNACTLEIRRGEVYGLLGPNGAGKTTLLRLLLGFHRPTSGTARVHGWDCWRQSLQVRRRTAYLPGDARLFGVMTGSAVLNMICRIRGGDPRRFEAVAASLQLDLRRRVAFMSTGMRQKLALASVLASPAELYILDEPTANLDPTVRAETLRAVRQLQRQGATILFSSHVLSEIEEVADRVAILREGCLVHLQEMHDLRTRHWIRGRATRGDCQPPPSMADAVDSCSCRDGRLEMIVSGELHPWLSWLGEQRLEAIRIEPVGLKAVYHRFHPLEVESVAPRID